MNIKIKAYPLETMPKDRQVIIISKHKRNSVGITSGKDIESSRMLGFTHWYEFPEFDFQDEEL